jgi:hypothetical protein
MCDVVVTLNEDLKVCDPSNALQTFFGYNLHDRHITDTVQLEDRLRLESSIDQARSLRVPQCLSVMLQRKSVSFEATILLVAVGVTKQRYLVGIRREPKDAAFLMPEELHTPQGCFEAEPIPVNVVTRRLESCLSGVAVESEITFTLSNSTHPVCKAMPQDSASVQTMLVSQDIDGLSLSVASATRVETKSRLPPPLPCDASGREPRQSIRPSSGSGKRRPSMPQPRKRCYRSSASSDGDGSSSAPDSDDTPRSDASHFPRNLNGIWVAMDYQNDLSDWLQRLQIDTSTGRVIDGEGNTTWLRKGMDGPNSKTCLEGGILEYSHSLKIMTRTGKSGVKVSYQSIVSERA